MRFFALVVFSMLTLLSQLHSASAQGRHVLLIGNEDYLHVPSLSNPVNDVIELGSTFRNLGYIVQIERNVTRSELLASLQEFRSRTQGAEHAIVYYAGHGIEIAGQNYLIPIDAKLTNDTDVEFEAVSASLIASSASGATKLSLIVLDACRNNPFIATMGRLDATRNIGRGLAKLEPRNNQLVAFSAREGTLAFDGEGNMSPYAQAFKDSLEKQGLEIGKFFRVLRDQVLENTGQAQEPFLYGSLSAEDVFFSTPSEAETAIDQSGAPFRVTSDIVSRAQENLNTLRLGAGPADGRIGPRTQAALALFQKEHGLPVSGLLDVESFDALQEVSAARQLEAPDLDVLFPVQMQGTFCRIRDGNIENGLVDGTSTKDPGDSIFCSEVKLFNGEPRYRISISSPSNSVFSPWVDVIFSNLNEFVAGNTRFELAGDELLMHHNDGQIRRNVRSNLDWTRF